MLVLLNTLKNLKNREKLTAIITANVVWIIIFGLIYYYFAEYENQYDHFNLPNDFYEIIHYDKVNDINYFKKMTLLDCIYFSGITHLTIGYGDMAGKSPIVKLIILAQIFVMILFLGLGLN